MVEICHQRFFLGFFSNFLWRRSSARNQNTTTVSPSHSVVCFILRHVGPSRDDNAKKHAPACRGMNAFVDDGGARRHGGLLGFMVNKRGRGDCNATNRVVCAYTERRLERPHFTRVQRTIESVAIISVPLPSIFGELSLKSRSLTKRIHGDFGQLLVEQKCRLFSRYCCIDGHEHSPQDNADTPMPWF